MNRDEVNALQKAQFDILIYVDNICKKLGINYFLAFGSLLGAIRHGGPIPWDADIDISMFRSDYETLREYCIKNNDGIYYYSDYSTDKYHISPHALLINKSTHIVYSKSSGITPQLKYDGVYIDIFPIDETSDIVRFQQKQAKRITRIRNVISLKQARVYYGKTNLIKKILKKIVAVSLMPFSFQYLGKMLSIEQRKYDGCGSDCYVIPTDKTCFDRIVPKSYYYPERRISYNGEAISIPAKAEEILKQRYGNYLILPPEKDRWIFLDTVIENVIY